MKSWGLCLLFSWLSIWFMSETIFIYRLRVRMGLKNISEFNFEDLPAFRQLCNPNSPSMGLGFILAFMLCQTQSASHKGLERRRQWQPTPVLLPGKSHGWRSLVGCSPWGRTDRTRLSDFTFTFHFHALEKEMATHSSDLAWRIPGTGDPGGVHRVRNDWSDLAAAARALRRWRT